MLKQYHLLKEHNMQIITNQINISVGKTQLMSIIQDILVSEDNAQLLKAIAPAIADKFEQFPEFTNISITSINEDGSANVTLKMPRSITTKSTETDDEPVDEVDLSDTTFEE